MADTTTAPRNYDEKVTALCAVESTMTPALARAIVDAIADAGEDFRERSTIVARVINPDHDYEYSEQREDERHAAAFLLRAARIY